MALLIRRRLLLQALDKVPYLSWRGIRRTRRDEELLAGKPVVDIALVYGDMKKKFDEKRYVKASHLNTLLNNCHTKEDIAVGVEAIREFRSSLSKLQISTGAVAVRACCRVGVEDKALEMIQNKIEYGVFLSKSAYSYLVQHFVEKKEFEKAVQTYEILLQDEEELRPLYKTFHSAVHACCCLGTVDGVRRALHLNELSRKRKLFMSIKLYHSLGSIACQQSDPDLCLDVMRLLTDELNIRFSPAQVGLVMRARIMKGENGVAVGALESLLQNHEQLEVLPQSTLDLVAAVDSSGDENLQKCLKNMLEKFKSLGKRLPDRSTSAVETVGETVYVDRSVECLTQRETEVIGSDNSELVGHDNSTTVVSEDK